VKRLEFKLKIQEAPKSFKKFGVHLLTLLYLAIALKAHLNLVSQSLEVCGRDFFLVLSLFCPLIFPLNPPTNG
jgi:hypothetical protein